MSTTLTKLYSKQDVAQIQINRSIQLLLDEQDLVSAITLAGAAEEILGRLLEKENQKNILTDIIDTFSELSKNIKGLDKKLFVKDMNFFRNAMKHHNNEEDLEILPIPIEAVHEIINRAIENYWRLTGTFTEQMERFHSIIHD